MPNPEDTQENFEVEEEQEDLEGYEDFEDFEMSSSADVSEAVNRITTSVLDTIEAASAVREGFFFPKGIDLIEVTVDIGGVSASVKIAGPASK